MTRNRKHKKTKTRGTRKPQLNITKFRKHKKKINRKQKTLCHFPFAVSSNTFGQALAPQAQLAPQAMTLHPLAPAPLARAPQALAPQALAPQALVPQALAPQALVPLLSLGC